MNKEIYIVGGGLSLKDFNFDKIKNKDTIVINKSIFYVSNPTYFITMDYTFLSKIDKKYLFDNYITTTKIFIVCLFCKYLQEIEGKIIDIRTNLVYNLKDFDIIIKCKNPEGIGKRWNDFRAGFDSGYSALQLAILLGYTKIYLLGIDLIANKDTHFHKGYGENYVAFNNKLDKYYSFWLKGVAEIKKQYKNLEIFNCSKISRLNNILPYKEI